MVAVDPSSSCPDSVQEFVVRMLVGRRAVSFCDPPEAPTWLSGGVAGGWRSEWCCRHGRTRRHPNGRTSRGVLRARRRR